MRLTLCTATLRNLCPSAELTVVRRISLDQRLPLSRGELDVADPKAHRRFRDANSACDLVDRSTLLAPEVPSQLPLACFHFGKHTAAHGRKSARPGSNRRDDLGRVACYHYTTG